MLIKYLAISRLLDLQMLPLGSETLYWNKKVCCQKIVSILIFKSVWSALSIKRIWYLLDTNILLILTSFYINCSFCTIKFTFFEHYHFPVLVSFSKQKFILILNFYDHFDCILLKDFYSSFFHTFLYFLSLLLKYFLLAILTNSFSCSFFS